MSPRPAQDPAQDGAPPELPGYRFIKPIGAGGNAQVYLYEQHLPSRKVAVKVLNESALSGAARRRFTAEANVTAGLAHRHIVQVFDAKVTDDGRPYLVMPYYPQPNLSVRARRSHFSVTEVLRIGIQIGSAVETSHRNGVLHRDIKPQNILTDSYGEPALTDFGIATTRADEGPEGLSVPWSPPEILHGTGPGDKRSDVYSLGATLWHLLVGRSPFEDPGGDNTPYALMGRIKSDPVPRTQRSDVPDSLERLLRQAMAKDPAARPQTAMDLIRGLQSIEQELRLPVTQPILAADESVQGDARGGDTVIHPAVRSGETTFGRDRGTGATGARSADRRQPAGPAATWGPGAGGATEGPGAGAADPRTHTSTVGGMGTPPHGRTVKPPWGQPGQGSQSGGPVQPAQPAWGQPAEDAATLARMRVRLDPWDGWGPGAQGPGARVRQFPAEPPEAATVARSAAARGAEPFGATRAGVFGAADVGRTGKAETVGSYGEVPEGREAGGRGRILAFAGGGALLAVVAVVALLAVAHGGGNPTPAPTGAGQATQTGGAGNAIGPGGTAPDQPTVTARRVSADQVEFSWTYGNPASGDTFRWREVSGGTAIGLADKRDLPLTVPEGKTVCITVTVRNVGGTPSQQSNPVCSPQ